MLTTSASSVSTFQVRGGLMRACERRILLLLLAMLVGRTGWAQTSIQYDYDELGRLIAVIDPGGDTAVYHYDAVGNVTAIDRHVSSQVSIISFSPTSGPVGTTVAIYGTGFSATASQDTVTVHGTTATISSATTTKLVVTVPSGATTGTIGVTAPGGSATSATNFTVASLATPTITGFTPTAGVPSTSVTISGTNFDSVLANDRTAFNITKATLTAASATSLTTSVPASSGSGHITVRTPLGTAVSSDDFIVPPSPYTAGDVATSGRIPFATATTVTISTANKIGLVLFDGTAGQRVSVKATSTTITSALLTLLKPDNTSLASVSISSSSTGFLDVQTLPTTGTYVLMVDPTSTYTGSTTLTLYDVPADPTTTLTVGGSSATLTTTTAGQNARASFSGTAAQSVIVHVTSNSIGLTTVSLLKPNGVQLTWTASANTSFDLALQLLSTTGTYSVAIDPSSTNTGSLTVSVAAASAALTVNSTSPLTTVSVTAGSNVTVGVSGGPANTTDWVAMHQIGSPDGTYLDWQYLNGTKTAPGTGTSSATLTFTISSTPGKYEFRFFASNGYTRLAISTNVAATSTASLSVNGSALGTAVTVAPSASVTVGVSNGPAHTTDWVGLYAIGGADTAPIAWQYLNGTQTAPGTGSSSATLTFTMPATLGDYDFRFFASNGYSRLAVSTTVTVTPP